MFSTIYEMLQDFFYYCVNTGIEILAQLVGLVTTFLPEFGLPQVLVNFGTYPIVQTMNWLFPVGIGIACVNAYIFSVGLYFTVGIVTRWAKVSN